MRSLDYMNRVEAYVNRLNSERRTVLETIPQVRFLDLMADEINCADMTADCEEDENKKIWCSAKSGCSTHKGLCEEKSCTGGLQQLASFFMRRYVGRSGLPWDFCFFCDNCRRDEGTHDWLFA